MIMTRNIVQDASRAALVIAALILASGSARAQTTTARPWSIGVSPAQQQHAETLYQEGNRDFTNGFVAAAVTKYQAALQHWNHPGIHYNLALALISLDRPLEAYESILAALGHGTDALLPEEYQRAMDYKRVLRQQIASVEVVCDEPGAAVTLDGKPLFTGPGRITTMVLPGQHQLVASRTGYLTTTKDFTLAGGGRTQIDLRLAVAYQPAARVQDRRVWPQWMVLGLGLGAGTAAAMLHWQSNVDSGRLDASLRQRCPAGCMPYPEDLSLLQERVKRQRTIAYAGYVWAGTFLVVGTTLAYLNRPQPVATRARRDTVQFSLSAGDSAGSPGISVHIPF